VYTEPFSFEEECKHYLLVRLYDCLGNGLNGPYWDLEVFYVDDQAPELIKTVGEPSMTDDYITWWVTTDTPINLSAIDKGCCPSDIFIDYRIWFNGIWTNWIPYTHNFTFNEVCTHYLEVRVYDCLGNMDFDNETFIVHGPSTPPVLDPVVITHPLGGSIVQGTVNITFINVSGDCDPTVYIDGAPKEPSPTYNEPELTWYYHWDTTTTWDGTHLIQVKAPDCASDSDTLMVLVDNNDESDPTINIYSMETIDDGRLLNVTLYAKDDVTLPENLHKDGRMRLWIPGGRRNAPTIWSADHHNEITEIYHYSGHYYYAHIAIYKYQHGAEITLCADVTDEAGNYKPAAPQSYMIQSTICYDYWLQDGWNQLIIPYGCISCSHILEDVLGSVDGLYNRVYKYNPSAGDLRDLTGVWTGWELYRVQQGYPNELTTMYEGEIYHIHMNNSQARFYISGTAPEIAITFPTHNATYDDVYEITGWTSDIETPIHSVVLELSTDDGLYWDGMDWTLTQTALICDLQPGNIQTWSYLTTGIWILGKEYTAKATAYDMNGCPEAAIVSFMIRSPPVANDDTAQTTIGTHVDIDVLANDYDPDGYLVPASVSIIEPPFNGTTMVNTITGEVTYQPDPEFVGEDFFFYNVQDDDGLTSNTAMVTITVNPLTMFSISGEITYDGNQYGPVIVYLSDDLLSHNILETKIIYPPDFPLTYMFDNLEPGTYYVGAYMDSNENDSYESTEPIGFAINQTWHPDPLNIVDTDITHADITLVDLTPSLDIEKTVWDGDFWVNETDYVSIGDTIRFKLHMINTGNTNITDVSIHDILPYGFLYNNNVEVDAESEYTFEMFEDDINHGVYHLFWNFTDPLESSSEITITFDTKVNDFAEAEYVLNWVRAAAYYFDQELTDEDTVKLYYIFEQPSIHLEKTVWDTEYDIWTDFVEICIGETVRYNITIINDGPYVLSNLNITDYLVPDCHYYLGDGDTTLRLDGSILMIAPIEWNTNVTWELTGIDFNPDSLIHLEFDVHVVDVLSDGDNNVADVSAYCTATDTEVNDTDTAMVYAWSCNIAPYAPHTPTPENGETEVEMETAILSWYGGDPNEEDIVSYYHYFGTDPDNLDFYGYTDWNATETGPFTSNLGVILLPETIYYWKIIATDNHGASTAGPLWNFTTKSIEEGNPPVVDITFPEDGDVFNYGISGGLIINGTAYDVDTYVDEVYVALYYLDTIPQYYGWDNGTEEWTWSTTEYYFIADNLSGTGTLGDPLKWAVWLEPAFPVEYIQYHVHAKAYDHDPTPLMGEDANYFYYPDQAAMITANDDYIEVPAAGTISLLTDGEISVLTNDTNPSGLDLSCSVDEDVKHGALTLNENGTFIYTHDGGMDLTDYFTYIVTDSLGRTDTATVYITIKLTTVGCTVETPDQRDSIYVGEEFFINVYIDPSEEIAGWEFYMEFTPTLANATLVENGDEWPDGQFDEGIIDNDLATINAIQAFKMEDYSTTNHTAYTITFTALQPGTFTISFNEITSTMADPTANLIPVVFYPLTIEILPVVR